MYTIKFCSSELDMKHSRLQTLLFSSDETEEPWPKKLKIDRSYVSSEKEQRELLERFCYVDKKLSSKPLSFPVISWNFNQICFEPEAKNDRNLITNLRQSTLANASLQPRLVGNTSFTEKWTLESKDDNNIKNGSSKSHNSLDTESESWALLVKEREKSIQSGNISKENELLALNSVFYNVLPGNLSAKIESLPTEGSEFQSNEYATGCHQVYEILKSNKQDHIPKSNSDAQNNSQLQGLCSPTIRFIKGEKSDLRSLLCEYKSVMNANSNISSYEKQAKSSANHYYRSKKAFQHIYMPYSRKRKVINPILVKDAAFELFLQDMRIYNYNTSAENNTKIFSQIIVLNTQQRKISNEKCTKECIQFSRDAMKDFIFSVAGNEEEQITNFIHPNQILPDNNFLSSTLWEESLCNPKIMYNLTADVGLFNCLASFPIISEILSCKHPGILTLAMEIYRQKGKGKTFQENSILKGYNRHENGGFRNINFISRCKYVPNYTGMYKMNKDRYDICEESQETPCDIVDKQPHFSYSDTFQKICLSEEEADEIYFIGNIIVHAEKNEKYNNVYTATDQRITDSGSCIWTHICVPSQLFTMQNSWLEEGIKGGRFHGPKAISQFPHHEINNVSFPIISLNSRNTFNFFSKVQQYLTSAKSHRLLDQNIVNVKGWHSEIAIHGQRGKPNGFAFGKIKDVIEYQFSCSSILYNSLKHNVEDVESVNLYLQKGILLSNPHNSEEISEKQNAEDADKIEKGNIEQSQARKSSQPQNLSVPYLKDKSTKSVGFNDMVLSNTMKQQHFDDAKEEHLSLNTQLVNKRYEFEMKDHFDLVLKELHIFNEISKENENNLACGERDEMNKENSKKSENSFTFPEGGMIEKDPLVPSHCEMLDADSKTFCQNKVNASSSVPGIPMNNAAVHQNKNEQHPFNNRVLERPGEQEVPLEFSLSSTSDEELFYPPPEEHCSSWCKQPPIWKPAFVPHSFTEERSFSFKTEQGKCFLDGIIRVQPLQTCHRPLRVGLSRRAKPRQLHPYLR
ncbi:RAD51-associated protein 2 isoform X2 [Sceloporus undulatus]|uniref:RAD51-associated protein 2 isoform X2 n=1 Tax=Sceloporus undulatus TaxID=8520 RepID=UPI001C4BEB84|nr:RAD51-associated protein 2 isoform X2 [Sceloporus undulatus]